MNCTKHAIGPVSQRGANIGDRCFVQACKRTRRRRQPVDLAECAYCGLHLQLILRDLLEELLYSHDESEFAEGCEHVAKVIELAIALEFHEIEVFAIEWLMGCMR